MIVPSVEGTLGAAGWYVGEVTVSWDGSDTPTPVTSSPCEPTVISSDSTGTTLTCSATSSGGVSNVSVTIMRDATPPTITCDATPASLWPPNGKLVPIGVAIRVSDATSGPSGFELTGTATSIGDATADIVGFDLGNPDVAGLLRASRPGAVSERDYTLTYTAYDAAGTRQSASPLWSSRTTRATTRTEAAGGVASASPSVPSQGSFRGRLDGYGGQVEMPCSVSYPVPAQRPHSGRGGHGSSGGSQSERVRRFKDPKHRASRQVPLETLEWRRRGANPRRRREDEPSARVPPFT